MDHIKRRRVVKYDCVCVCVCVRAVGGALVCSAATEQKLRWTLVGTHSLHGYHSD